MSLVSAVQKSIKANAPASLEKAKRDESRQLSDIQKEAISLIRSQGGRIYDNDPNIPYLRTLRSLRDKGLLIRNENDEQNFWQIAPISADDAATIMAADTETLNTQAFRDTCVLLFGTYGWQTKLGTALGVHGNTVAKWAAGRLAVPVYITALLESLVALQQAGVPLPPRFRFR